MEKTCQTCFNSEERYEEINGYTYLCRYCSVKNNKAVDDDSTCSEYKDFH